MTHYHIRRIPHDYPDVGMVVELAGTYETAVDAAKAIHLDYSDQVELGDGAIKPEEFLIAIECDCIRGNNWGSRRRNRESS